LEEEEGEEVEEVVEKGREMNVTKGNYISLLSFSSLFSPLLPPLSSLLSSPSS